ncbi:MAG: class I SAM-dependent methyltransferase [Cyclobacteriaceae bacterium]
MNDFNFIAPFYSSLSRIVFGDTLMKAQTHFFTEIPEGAHVLFVGGGNGDVLKYCPSSWKIDFLEKSPVMLELAKKKVINHDVQFLQEDFFLFESNQKYHAVITPFFFDMFSNEQVKKGIERIKTLHLKPKGIWLFTDFVENKPNRFKKILVKTMYLFFRLTAKLEQQQLPDFEQLFNEIKAKQDSKMLFFGNMIKSNVFRF